MAAKVLSLTPAQRFWPKVNKTDTCWLWTGYIKPNGYATFYPGGGRHVDKIYVHRWAYESSKGPIPDGLEIDHLCNVRNCVNPEHLEVVTHRVNLDRRNANKTHCAHGHLFDEANTYMWRGGRMCRTCRSAAHVRRMSIVRGV